MMSSDIKDTTGNPLLQPFETPFETPPFNEIRNEHFLTAFEIAIAEARNEIDDIVKQKAAPTFGNTIEALARNGILLERVSAIFFNLLSADTDDEKQNLAQTISPMLSEFQNDVGLNETLFERVKAVYAQAGNLTLTTEQQTLLERTYKGFVRSGANLSEADKEKYRAYTKELSTLTLTFNNNVLAETNAYTLHIEDKDNLSGLPESAIEEAANTAKARGLGGWCFTLQVPSYLAFMKYASNRALRKEMYKAYNTKGAQRNEYNNEAILKRIAELRLLVANLLGYKTYADYALEERMAESSANVNRLLTELLDASKPYALKEMQEVQAFAEKCGADFNLMPWDWSFYSEKLKDKKYNYNEELIRPYFPLENVRKGVFELAERLYGLSFVENYTIQKYHPDVQCFEVYDEDGTFLSVLYLDFFPRESKRGGAWMTSFREQYRENGTDVRPIISIVTNFSKPTDTKPSLLTFYEVKTFLHEFGHALHGMLSNVTYASLSGTNVFRDFVELPSQIMENWAAEQDFLDLFASHYQTQEKIPANIVQQIIDSQNFLSGYACVRQLSFGLLDMAYHSQTAPVDESVATFEQHATEPTQLFPAVSGCLISTSFSHIFAGGYAAGYYGYKWAEVLDADAFSVFRDKGIFNLQTASSFRENILSLGGTEHPMVLYKRFRGQEPGIEALLVRSGFVPEN
jgi:peptidyl-dipeptidase Dcp